MAWFGRVVAEILVAEGLADRPCAGGGYLVLSLMVARTSIPRGAGCRRGEVRETEGCRTPELLSVVVVVLVGRRRR